MHPSIDTNLIFTSNQNFALACSLKIVLFYALMQDLKCSFNYLRQGKFTLDMYFKRSKVCYAGCGIWYKESIKNLGLGGLKKKSLIKK